MSGTRPIGAGWNIPGPACITPFIDDEGGQAGMATHRLADILKSRSDLSDDEIERMDEDEAWHWIHAGTSEGEPTDKGSGDYPRC